MKAVCWYDTEDVRVESVPDPRILNPHDAIVKIRQTTICGSDLHLYDGLVPSMMKGDIIGHEIMGEVVETGPDVKTVREGDRVVVCSVISCGRCIYCRNQQYSLCDNTNPHAGAMEKMYHATTAGVYGFSHLYGGYAGAQAEYVRVPFADVGAFKVPDGMSDVQALMFSDIFPTGYMGAEMCDLRRGDVVAVWGCGPIGQMAILSAGLLGASRVIAIDNVLPRLQMAAEHGGAITINHDHEDVYEALMELTGGRGPDACIDAVGMEAHAASALTAAVDQVKKAMMLQVDKIDVVRQMIDCAGKGARLAIVGVYGGPVDRFPLGTAFTKALQIRMGQQHGPRYIPRLLRYWEQGRVDPAYAVTHHLPLDAAPEAYRMFREKRDGCVKVVLQP